MQRWLSNPELLVSVLAIIVGTLVLWMILIGAAGRARRHFAALLTVANQSNDDPDATQHDVEAAGRRLTALRLLVNAARYALVISAILMTLRTLRVPLDSLLLPAGFLGAALGLGAQNLVRDIVAGLFIVFEGQFAVGDVVRINGTLGRVDQIGLRVTSLLDEAGHRFFFPNGAITTIETLPRRRALLLRVPLQALPEDKSYDEATAIVVAAVKRCDEDYDLLAGEVTQQLPSSTHSLVFRLPVRPLHETLVREKLPARIVTALEKEGYEVQKTAAGAEVEIFNAPAA
ncbi:MAG TPA: mechanosensitive ion channel domain-containing protein [Abditibacteriaceae bacterium]|jgi:small conductance mechanosensitive channel